MKKFVVTGGSGFIGSNLVKFLLNKNYFVINIDKLSYSANPYNLKEINKNKNYRFFKQDINNKSEILKILNRFKPIGIFNLAAETHVDRSIDDPKNFIKTNIVGVYNLLEAINKYLKKNRKKIKLVHVSTDEVYGDIKIGKKSNEIVKILNSIPKVSDEPYVSSLKTFEGAFETEEIEKLFGVFLKKKDINSLATIRAISKIIEYSLTLTCAFKILHCDFIK